MDTLTRGEANRRIEEAAATDRALDALQDLAVEWIGHSDHGIHDAEAYAEFLSDYVVECCSSDDERSNGPQDSDDTGIPA